MSQGCGVWIIVTVTSHLDEIAPPQLHGCGVAPTLSRDRLLCSLTPFRHSYQHAHGTRHTQQTSLAAESGESHHMDGSISGTSLAAAITCVRQRSHSWQWLPTRAELPHGHVSAAPPAFASRYDNLRPRFNRFPQLTQLSAQLTPACGSA